MVGFHGIGCQPRRGVMVLCINYVIPSGFDWMFTNSIVISSLRDWMLGKVCNKQRPEISSLWPLFFEKPFICAQELHPNCRRWM